MIISITSGFFNIIGAAIRWSVPTSQAAQVATTCYPFPTNFPNLEASTSLVTGKDCARYEELCKKLHFKKTPELRSGYVYLTAFAQGTNLFSFAPKLILIDRVSSEIDPDVMWMFTKHEISHLCNNDALRTFVIQLVSNVALAYFFPSFPTSAVMVYFGQCAITGLVGKTIGRKAESAADEFAYQNATEDELKAALRGFEAVRLTSIARDKILFAKSPSIADLSELGTRVLFDPHTYPESRIQRVEQILKQRNPHIDFEAVKADPRVEALATWWTFARNNPPDSSRKINRAATEEMIRKCLELANRSLKSELVASSSST